MVARIAPVVTIVLTLVLALAACGDSETSIDAPAAPACTGAVYDPCTANDQCTSQNCRLYAGTGLQVCTQTCSAAMPCPNDSTGAVACNMMGNCRPAVANNCQR